MTIKQTPRKGINLTGDRIEQFNEVRAYFIEKIGLDKGQKLSDQRVLSLAFAGVRFLQLLERENGAKFAWELEYVTFRDRRFTEKTSNCCPIDCECRQPFDGETHEVEIEFCRHDRKRELGARVVSA